MKVFVDTSIFIALFVDKDMYHQEVIDKYHQYQQQKSIFLSSNYVLPELFTRLIYDFGRTATEKAIAAVAKSIDNKSLSILNIDEGIFQESLDVMIKFSEHKISFTDASSYILFKKYNFDEIFTLDSDFKKMRISTSF